MLIFGSPAGSPDGSALIPEIAKPYDLSGDRIRGEALLGEGSLEFLAHTVSVVTLESWPQILDLIQLLNCEFQKTVVMVTHDPLATRRASRLLHLDNGTLVDDAERMEPEVGIAW